MATLVWDNLGERVYQSGVDKGVLYLPEELGVVWNGLTSVEDSSNSELKSSYLDGVKYLEMLIPGDFEGKLKALTYPDEFDSVNGIAELASGFNIYDQAPKSFGLSYRTKIGNDVDGIDHGYVIHILYNLLAKSDTLTYNTLGESVDPIEFSWSLTGTPPSMGKYRPTVHISVNSLTTPADILKILEDRLYGTVTSGAGLPSIQEVAEYFGYHGALLIVDHGDGTWSAIDDSGAYVSMLDPTIFWIQNSNAVYLDADTYQVSSTNMENSL